jgi:hypothetical protein
MRRSPDLNELIRLAPAFARGVRYDLLFLQRVIQSVAGDASIPAGVRSTYSCLDINSARKPSWLATADKVPNSRLS